MNNTTTKTIHISPDNMTYGISGSITFRDSEGNQYTADRKGAFELASLVLEALGMNLIKRDDLLFGLEDAYEAEQENCVSDLLYNFG